MRLIEGEIQTLKGKVLDMAELVLKQLDKVIEAVVSLDYDLAEKIRRKDKKVNKFDTKIDKSCERIIALYQPVANDLRFIFSVLKINAYLEQIGDIINSIARKILEIREQYESNLLEELKIPTMFELTKQILKDALSGFFNGSQEIAKSVFPKDDAIDDIHRQVNTLILAKLQQKPERANEYLQLLLIVKNLEKIADFAVCIAEEALFHMEGVFYKHSKLKYAYKDQSIAQA
ncbi:MAG: phosphate signaling complex protein PhoU [Bacteroidia bacterium]|nr:phosphate signaling complex protein PhoU [Bacteroidia bacterium]MDW8157590.1 phosphate signaling complex protein PhoU [Bacteroidia bacterium]